jgi:hypothetical protein
MRAVANFSNWNPPHFLDTAELSHGMAIGYDWLYHDLSVADRRLVERGILRHGFDAYQTGVNGSKGNPWSKGDWNWNQVVNGGMTVAALAFGDAVDTPRLVEIATTTLHNATSALTAAFASYASQGSWPEGAGYWGYGTRYALTASTSLTAATGDDGGLSRAAGFHLTGKFCIYHMGPANRNAFNWADAGDSPCDSAVENLFVLAAMFPALATTYGPTARTMVDDIPLPDDDVLSEYTYTPGEVASKTCSSWYRGNEGFRCVVALAAYSSVGSMRDLPTLLPLDYLFQRRAVGFFRSSWTSANASWLGFKGCNSTAEHGDLDAGTFVLEMAGERWAIDLGGGNYALKGYWDKGSKDGERYSYYRKSTRGHNTLTFGGWDGHVGTSNQKVGGTADRTKITHFRGNDDAKGKNKSAVVDMTGAYVNATSVVRTFTWSNAMTRLVVSDTFSFANGSPAAAHNATWAMHTRANVTIDATKGNREAVLSQGGVELVAVLKAPVSGAVFTWANVNLAPPQHSTEGVRKLMVQTTATVGAIMVEFYVKTSYE